MFTIQFYAALFSILILPTYVSIYIYVMKLFSARLISIKFWRRFIFRAERIKTANKSRLTNNNSDRAMPFFPSLQKIVCVIKIQRVSTEWKGALCARARITYIRSGNKNYLLFRFFSIQSWHGLYARE